MLTNWSRTVDLQGVEATPTQQQEVAALVRDNPSVLALGSAHSFSPVAVTPGLHIATTRLSSHGVDAQDIDSRDVDSRDIDSRDIDSQDIEVVGQTATVPAGMTYAQVGRALHERGLALAAMASLPHITVGGAIATGTHGSGDAIGTLSSAAVGLEIVTADGDVRWIRRGIDSDFPGWVVALGALGVVTRVELAVEPAYDVAQTVFTGLDLDVLEADFDAVFSAATSVSVFTRWRPEPDGQLWLKRRVDREGAWPGGPAFGAVERAEPLHPLELLDPVHCTEQLGKPGPWHHRLPHFRADFTPSSGDEIQAEYLLPRDRAVAAIMAVRSMHERITPLLHVTEIRTMRADDLWLSPAYGVDAVGIHFTWHKDDSIFTVLPDIEEALLPLGARPHWGKVTTATPEQVRGAFPRWDDFAALREDVDPGARFRSPFVTRLLGASG